MLSANRLLSSPATWLTAVVILLGAAAIIVGRSGENSPLSSSPPPPPVDCETEDWKSAMEFEAQENWGEAVAAWEKVIAGLPSEETLCRSDAERYLLLCRDKKKQAESEPATEEPIAITAGDRSSGERPEPIPEPTLAGEYPAGRTIRSISAVQITGRGRNRAWGLQSEGHFDWQAQVDATTRILESSPERGFLKVRQEFHNVSQLLVVRDKTFSLDPAPTLAQKGVQNSIGALLSLRIPKYRALRAGMVAYEKLDSNYQGLLTGTLKQLGLDRDDWVVPEGTTVAAQLDRISGSVIEYDYVSGFGVSEIRLVNADRIRLSKAELLSLSQTLSLMLDYHVFPVRDRAVGEPWDVRVEDVSGLFAVQGMEAQASGKLTLQREKGEGEFVPLKVVSGTVDLQMESSDGRQTARLGVISGGGQFSLTDYFLSEADMELRINSLWQNPRSLLFNTDAARDLKARAVYRAENQTGKETTAEGAP